MKYILEYIWLGGNYEIRTKTKVLETPQHICLHTIQNIPAWNYDGSSTSQSSGEYSEMNLLPVALYKNPLRNYPHSYLVLCETRDKDNNPLETNKRAKANELFQKNLESEPWFGLEQEYFILNNEIETKLRLGNITQGQYYCSVGSKNAFLRKIVDKHLEACIEAGLNISGSNAEVSPYQWEFQIGPCTGIDAGDQLWVARFLLERIAEDEGYYIDWSPKPFENINGSGCHTNFSTKNMRTPHNSKNTTNIGLGYILESISNLEKTHSQDMPQFGIDNNKRMSGLYETSSYDKFMFDINKPVNRGASVRISYDTINNGYGYFEDRRPASNMDPYVVTSIIFSSTVN